MRTAKALPDKITFVLMSPPERNMTYAFRPGDLLSINEVRQRFPSGLQLRYIHHGVAGICGQDGDFYAADFRSFLGSSSFRAYYYRRRLNRFERQSRRFAENRFRRQVMRHVYGA